MTFQPATVSIYGAGMSGLLAAQMLRRYRPVVFEAQAALPDNHGALLRFRSNVVSEATGIPLQKVFVQKALRRAPGILANEVTLAEGNAYSAKVSGEVTPRSVLSLAPGERYVAPPTFLAALADGTSIQFNSPLTADALRGRSRTSDPIISTVPMPTLMALVDWPTRPAFRFRSIFSIRARICDPKVNVFQTIYYPSPKLNHYRASITGDQLIIEFVLPEDLDDELVVSQMMVDDVVEMVLADFGLSNARVGTTTVKDQRYGKLVPLADEERQSFIMAMSDELSIYSVGRFATWRQILMDDVVRDIKIVESFITKRSDYARRSHWR